MTRLVIAATGERVILAGSPSRDGWCLVRRSNRTAAIVHGKDLKVINVGGNK